MCKRCAIGIQLDIDCVNPIYYDMIKVHEFFASHMVSANTFSGPSSAKDPSAFFLLIWLEMVKCRIIAGSMYS